MAAAIFWKPIEPGRIKELCCDRPPPMMKNNWENFLKNLGEWRGSFTQISLTGEVLGSTPSILNLEGFDNNQLVQFRLRRYSVNGYEEPPLADYTQEYRTLGLQNIFFETGAFSKGSLQLSPVSEFGAEYGFVAGDRRLRFVQLYDPQGNLNALTLIREFRSGSHDSERPQLTVDQLVGTWQGKAHTVYSDWSPSQRMETRLEVSVEGDRLQQTLTFGDRTLHSTAQIQGQKLIFDEGSAIREILLLPDGASSNTPLQVKVGRSFLVEVGWLVNPNERQRLIRSYSEKGEWISATHVIEHRV
ncbi:MAG: DUF3598 family protein [Oculatellaceae cyanobacterium Prado106]|nr:DUF3598 family protein [Oculatellaceae cyanobacterium Prado106]